MFARSVILYSSITLLIIFGGLYKICVVSERDIHTYQKMLQECLQQQTLSETTTAHQIRKEVRKDIFFSQEDARLQYRIQSSASLLTINPTTHGLEVLENLSDIRCWMQEKIFTFAGKPTQQIRFLQAKEGIYKMHEHQFLAQDVSVSLLRMPGKELRPVEDTSSSFLKGKASDISFYISGKSPKFEAENFQATFKQEEKLR